MHYRSVYAFCLVLALCFAGFSTVVGQADKPKDPPKEEQKVPPKKDESKKEEKKEEPKKEELLDEKAYYKLMNEDIKIQWGRVRATIRTKKNEDTAKNADELAKMAAKIVLSDSVAKAGPNKGKKLREQKDFTGWANDLKAHAEELSKQAKAGKWDKVEVEKDKIGKTCSNCHDVYDPKNED